MLELGDEGKIIEEITKEIQNIDPNIDKAHIQNIIKQGLNNFKKEVNMNLDECAKKDKKVQNQLKKILIKHIQMVLMNDSQFMEGNISKYKKKIKKIFK